MGQLSLQAALATRDPHAAARVTKYKPNAGLTTLASRESAIDLFTNTAAILN